MQLKEIKEILICKSETNECLLEKEIDHCYAADMMSDVLKSCKIGSLLITGLVNLQVVQISEIMDLKGIIFVSAKHPTDEIIEIAEKKSLPLLSTNRNMFEVCGILYSAGLRGKDPEYSGQKENNESRDTLQPVVPDKR